jgi:Domain of unknown function (DUF4403)
MTHFLYQARDLFWPLARSRYAALAMVGLLSNAVAAEKPPLAPDTVAPFATQSQISATIEFGLPALAAEIQKDIPRRLATIDERVSCVHRRVFVFRINANCDVRGFVERSGPISLYGRGERVYGSMSIYGAVEGQGANRFTARIRGETEARAVIEVEALPQLGRDWSVDLNFSDSFRWSEPPILHVLGREIPLAKYAEPSVRTQLAKVRSRATFAARRLDLHDKAARAWRQTFEPIQLSDNPAVWLQLTPHDAAFAGVRADAKTLSGTLALSGSAKTIIGELPQAVTPTALPPLGNNVAAPGAFDVILPIHIGYDLIKNKIAEALAAETSIKEIQVYPSGGKLVIGLRILNSSDIDAAAGSWVYLSSSLEVDADSRMARIADAAAIDSGNQDLAAIVNPLLSQLRDKVRLGYGAAYQDMLDAANKKLARPLKDGFRMDGRLSSARLEKVYLPADGVAIALRLSGELRILYGL